MALNQRTAKTFLSTTGSFNTITAGTTVAGPVLPAFGNPAVDVGSLVANVTTGITTNTITITPKWEVSNDGTAFNTVFASPGTAYVQVSATGTGSLVTTNYKLVFPAGMPSYPYVRLSFTVGVATGAAGDTYTISYNFIRRDFT